MNRWLGRLPIRGKLLLLAMVVACVALLVSNTVVFSFARDSSNRPSRINAMITAAASKYTGTVAAAIPSMAEPAPVALAKKPGAIVAAVEYTYAAPVPTAMSVFMSAARWRNAAHAPR